MHWDPDLWEPAALRQEETEATKNLLLVLTCKVRKTTLSCLLEGKHNPCSCSVGTAGFQGWGCSLSPGSSSWDGVILLCQDSSRLPLHSPVHGKDPPLSMASRMSPSEGHLDTAQESIPLAGIHAEGEGTCSDTQGMETAGWDRTGSCVPIPQRSSSHASVSPPPFPHPSHWEHSRCPSC